MDASGERGTTEEMPASAVRLRSLSLATLALALRILSKRERESRLGEVIERAGGQSRAPPTSAFRSQKSHLSQLPRASSLFPLWTLPRLQPFFPFESSPSSLAAKPIALVLSDVPLPLPDLSMPCVPFALRSRAARPGPYLVPLIPRGSHLGSWISTPPRRRPKRPARLLVLRASPLLPTLASESPPFFVLDLALRIKSRSQPQPPTQRALVFYRLFPPGVFLPRGRLRTLLAWLTRSPPVSIARNVSSKRRQ